VSQNFIDEVRAIVMSNISDEKFGVRKLASILGLSSSQTLRKVKSSTGKSVNQYIRELRLEKAAFYTF
jgi:AraC-like DNA-binding protein